MNTLPTASESSVRSSSSKGTAKPHARPGAVTPENHRPKSSLPSVSSHHATPNGALVSRPHVVAPASSPGLMALLKASLGPILNSTKLATFLIFAVVFPLVSLIVRLRRKKLSADSVNTANMVRKRLQAVTVAEGSVFGRAWGEVLKVVTDTIRMAGSGLV